LRGRRGSQIFFGEKGGGVGEFSIPLLKGHYNSLCKSRRSADFSSGGNRKKGESKIEIFTKRRASKIGFWYCSNKGGIGRRVTH